MKEGAAVGEPASAAGRGKDIVRGVGSLTVQSVLNAVLGFVLFASLVRFLSQGDYGTYSSVQVTVGIAGVVATFGLPAAIVRFLAPSSSEGGSGWGPAKAAFYVQLALSGSVSVVVALTAPFLSDYFLKGPSGAWVFYFGAAWLFATSLASSAQALLQGMRRYSLLAKVLIGSRLIAVAVAVAGLALYHSLSVAIASQVLLGALIIGTVVPVMIGPMKRADPRSHYRSVLKYSYLLGLAGVVGAVAGNADIVVVGGYLNPGSLGIYNATITISGVLSAFFVAPLVTTLFAETSARSESEEEIRVGTNLAIRFSLLTLLPASLVAAALAPQLFDLFSGGGAYTQGIPYLQLITLFYVFAAVQTIALGVLQGVSRTRQVLVVGAITAIVGVALPASLVLGFGLAGAAYSRVVVFVLGCGLSLYFVRGFLPRPADLGFYLKAFVASAVPALAVYIPSVMVSDRVITIVPYGVLGVILFAALVRALKLLSATDRAYLEHLLPTRLHWVLRFL